MTRLALTDIGPHLSDVDQAKKLRTKLLAAVSSEPHRVSVDCGGIESMSHSFARELFGTIAYSFGAEWLARRVKIVNASVEVNGTIQRAVRSSQEVWAASRVRAKER